MALNLFTRGSTEPTLEERHNGAAAKAEAALSVFALAQADLEDAAREHELTAALALSEVDRLTDIAFDAQDAADATRAKASKISELIG